LQAGTKFRSESGTLNVLTPTFFNMNSVMHNKFSLQNARPYEIMSLLIKLAVHEIKYKPKKKPEMLQSNV